MIKFFRKIRQRLLSENKFSKYLIYAIGEIVLVVIGILIALQINNWNNDRIERKLEKDILTEIVANLDFDLENIETRIGHNRFFGKNNQVIYEHLKNKTLLTDSLKFNYSCLSGWGNFQPMTIAYENLKSQGINIIKNENLRKEISELYDFVYKGDLKTHTQTLVPIHEILTRELNEHVITEIPFRSAKPADLIALQKDIQFQETLKTTAWAREWENSIFENAKEEMFKLKTLIEEELKVQSN